jgi:CRP-like cAMP-binding protein
MDILPRYLQYGAESAATPRSVIYRPGDPVGDKPVFYVIAGLVKVQYPMRSSSFTLWLHPDSLFGLTEALAECARLCVVQPMERTILYTWSLEDFFTAAGVSWELALMATSGMTRELRILNAEFGARLDLLEGSGR